MREIIKLFHFLFLPQKQEVAFDFLPVSVDEAGVDVVGSFQASDWLQADAGGLVGHDVDQPVLELVAGEVGADEARRVGFGVGQTLEETGERTSARESGDLFRNPAPLQRLTGLSSAITGKVGHYSANSGLANASTLAFVLKLEYKTSREKNKMQKGKKRVLMPGGGGGWKKRPEGRMVVECVNK